MVSLKDLILQEVQQEEPAQMLTGGISNNPENASWLQNFANNFSRGYRDNYDNRFSVNNLLPDETKNWQTRLGEGLGTVGRFIDSPLGRGLMAAGLNKALGYDNSLQEGLTAGVGRQNAMTADKVYRKQLSQMGYSDEDLNNIRGNITPQIYKGLADSLRLGNQRMTYGQLALFNDEIAELLKANPDLENQFIPLSMARDIYTKRKDKTEADIESTKARTEKTKKETEFVGKPKVTINEKRGGTTSTIIHKGGSGGGGGKGGGTTQPKPYTKPNNTKPKKLLY